LTASNTLSTAIRTFSLLSCMQRPTTGNNFCNKGWLHGLFSNTNVPCNAIS